MAFKHTNAKNIDYFLHSKEVQLRGSGKMQRIYYFRKDIDENALEELPSAYEVVENKRTGLPTLRKK